VVKIQAFGKQALGSNGTVNTRKRENMDKPKAVILPLITPGHARAKHKEETIGGGELFSCGERKPGVRETALDTVLTCLQKDGNFVRLYSVGS
jgi:hypothetical protein